MRTGDNVLYVSDVHPDYIGRQAIVDQFDMIGGMLSVKFDDGIVIWCFPDEIKY